MLDYIVVNFGICYDVFDNFQDIWKLYCVCMILENLGLEVIFNGLWVIYFCYIWVIELVYIKYNLSGYVICGSYGIKVIYINGC